jgi:hypothetical protein
MTHHSRGDVHPDPSDVGVELLYLTSVNPGSDGQTESADTFPDGMGRGHRPRRAVEDGQQPVPRRLDESAPKTIDLVAALPVMLLEEPGPATITLT